METGQVEKRIAPSASFQFKVDTGRVDWLYAGLKNADRPIELFRGPFPGPFTDLLYLAEARQEHLGFAALAWYRF